MIDKAVDNVTIDDIKALVEEQAREDRTLEYKRDLYGRDEKENIELAADITSFANTDGADLFVGIASKDGLPTELVGVEAKGLDAEILRIGQVCRTFIEPPLNPIVRAISISTDRSVLLLRIARSWTAPHFVRRQDWRRAYARSNSGKHILGVTEMGALFLGASQLPARISDWREERLELIRRGRTPFPIGNTPRTVLHLIPYSMLTNPETISAHRLNAMTSSFAPLGSRAFNWRVNIDGLLTVTEDPAVPKPCKSYCQVFRRGAVESSAQLSVHESSFSPNYLELHIIKATTAYGNALRSLNVLSPILVAITLLGVDGLGIPPELGAQIDAYLIDREELYLPEIVLEGTAMNNEAISVAMRPAFDALWNSVGAARSFSYDEKGVWRQMRW